ncbi:MAG TPA: hypothetical protein VF135_04705 [Terriglobales bacterium]
MKPIARTPGILLGVAMGLLMASAQSAVGAQQGPKLPDNPNDLVRVVVHNEVTTPAVRESEFYSWKERIVKPSRTTVRQYVETPQGLLARTLTLNDRPLSKEDRAKEDARIRRLLDPKQMQQKRKQQKEDENRTKKLVAALPDAFIYQYAGTEERDGHKLVNLKFTPNPNFDPPSRETLVFSGMEGSMTIDVTAMRLAKIDGTMVKDVSIGWGIIGHLDKGGKFFVEQAEVAKGNWEITKMRLNFTGKALIFKTIRIDETDTSTDFRQVPRMSIAEAIAFLDKADQDNGTISARENYK